MTFTAYVFEKRHAYDDGRDDHRRALDEIRRYEMIRHYTTATPPLPHGALAAPTQAGTATSRRESKDAASAGEGEAP